MLSVTLVTQRDDWHHALCALPTAHILQSWEWGEFKRQTIGWLPERFAYQNAQGQVVAVASVLTRRMGFLAVMYVPKGPVLDYADAPTREAVLDHLQGLARSRRAVWLKIDPDVPLATGIPTHETPDPDRPDTPDAVGQALKSSLAGRGWRFSGSQVQFRNTLTLDLTLSEEALLAQMSQGTRRKIRHAEKAGVTIREVGLADVETLYQLYSVTGERQEFLIRPLEYYKTAWGLFLGAGLGQAFLAEMAGLPVAGMVLFHLGRKVWYFYGMSSNLYREAQPNYLLQWTAIRWAKGQGYPLYDWWGAPDQFVEADPMWGVYRFKDGFGGQVVRHIGAWDYVPNGVLYWGYEQLLPRLLRLMRHRGETP